MDSSSSSSSITARPDVTVATTAPRVTPTPNRGAFKQVLANGIVRGAETAMKVLPGGPLMAVAVRSTGGTGSVGVPLAGGSMSTMSAAGPGTSTNSPNTLASAALSATGVAGSTTGTTGTTGTDGSLEATMQQSADMNLYYLKIQEDVNAQNRTFSTLSNVLKTEHDTVKTAIGNIR